MTPAFISGSIIILSLVVGVPISTNAEPVKVMDEASADGLFTLAQTNGMMRRGPLAWTSATANRKDASREMINRGTA